MESFFRANYTYYLDRDRGVVIKPFGSEEFSLVSTDKLVEEFGLAPMKRLLLWLGQRPSSAAMASMQAQIWEILIGGDNNVEL